VFISQNFLKHQIIFVSLMLIASVAIADNELDQREKAAGLVAQDFVKQLGGHLKNEMQTNGPEKAIKVCKDVAPQIASQLSVENGWKVARVTTKVRNPLMGMADQWERKVLADFEAKAGKGESYESMSEAAVVDEDGKFYFRYMKPLVIKPVCLTCHGGDEQLPATVKNGLQEAYPFDQAKGYKDGDLRGAVSIKQPMDIPLSKKF
jgi:cytochrome c553